MRRMGHATCSKMGGTARARQHSMAIKSCLESSKNRLGNRAWIMGPPTIENQPEHLSWLPLIYATLPLSVCL